MPSEKAIAEINENFTQMKNTFCAISKLEYLLEAVRLTYENIRDSRNPKKSMNDLGADGEGTANDFIIIADWTFELASVIFLNVHVYELQWHAISC